MILFVSMSTRAEIILTTRALTGPGALKSLNFVKQDQMLSPVPTHLTGTKSRQTLEMKMGEVPELLKDDSQLKSQSFRPEQNANKFTSAQKKMKMTLPGVVLSKRSILFLSPGLL